MTPLYTRKLHQALIDIGHQVEKDTNTPDLDQIKALFDKFLTAAESGKNQKKAVDELLGAVVRWEVGKL